MEAETSSSSSRVRNNNDHGFIFMDFILSWSIEDILNEELYRNQVEEIKLEFRSVNNYIGSFVYPLLEETRAQLCSSMEFLPNAPFARVESINSAKPLGKKLYKLNIGEWQNKFILRASEPYRMLPGDVLILTEYKPETVNDLKRFSGKWSFVSTVKTSEDEEVYLKVKTSNEIDPNELMRNSKDLFVVFLTNISSNRRVWNALHMDGNLKLVKQILSPRDMKVADESCNCCSSSEMLRDDSSLKRLLWSLNESQEKAIHACLSGIGCCDNNSKVKLIWGPPGTGKTKTLATLLFALIKMKFRVLICAPTNVAIKEVASRVVSIMKDSHGADSSETICSLGNILLFGNNERLKIDGEEVEEIYLDHRAQELVKCSHLSSCIGEMFYLLDGCVSRYNTYVYKFKMEKGDGIKQKSFLEFLRDEFLCIMSRLKECISILFTHLTKDFVCSKSLQKLVFLKNVLDSFQDLLFQNGLNSSKLERDFSMPRNYSCLFNYAEYQLLCKKRKECLEALHTAKDPLDGVQFMKSFKFDDIREFCLQNASLIFCTVSGSYSLHSAKMKPMDILVIDEAAQSKECESLIAIKVKGISHAILVGDECQLPSVVESTVSREVNFGRSLFERLSKSGHPKQLLSMQHRMHPEISLFPKSYFYFEKILDAANVKTVAYNKKYLPGKMFAPYSFINVAGGREEYDAAGRSRKNVAEVAVIMTILKNLHKTWLAKREKLCIGIVSPYVAQVAAVQDKIGQMYNSNDEFTVNVKSIDGFQGGEQDVIILSTVRTNNRTPLDFVSSHQRTNVALTRARHCLWVLGNERALSNNENVWKDIIIDAKKRNCFFSAEDDEEFDKAILDARKEMDEFDDLLMTDSILFRNSRWKVHFSDKFLRSFKRLRWEHSKKLVINLLENLSNGWRPKRHQVQVLGELGMLKQFKVENRYIIWSIEIVKHWSIHIQVLKIWDILPLDDLQQLAKRLGNVFARYSDDYIGRCKERAFYRDLEIPLRWPLSANIQKFKNLNSDNSHDNESQENEAEKLKFEESLLLIKYCSDSSPDVIDLDLPISLTEEQRRVILYPQSTFVLGRFGTGKTTVLKTKMIRKQKLHHSAMELVYGRSTSAIENCEESQENCGEAERPVLRQLFVTLSSKLCQEVKCNVSHFERLFCEEGTTSEASSSSVKDFHVPESLVNVPNSSYPLVVTFRKFLMMLDMSLGKSYFERINFAKNSSLGSSTSQSIVSEEAFLAAKEVTYEKFDSSYWPHFNSQKIKMLNSYQVFTEIMTHIKGGIEAAKKGKLSRRDYLTLSESRRSCLSVKKREMIYDIFENYENMKLNNREFDMADFVSDLHKRLRSVRYKGDKMHFVYVDEVQDLTMSEIALFKHVCPNVDEGFVFCGDTAQTIGRGIDFRFQDVRALFYEDFVLESKRRNNEKCKEKGHVSEMFMLSENFRTNAEVLKLSQSIIELLFHFFPHSVDNLKVETSLVAGEAPFILLGSWLDTILAKDRYGEKDVEFRAIQAIVVRDDEIRQEIMPLVGEKAPVLTILECKGLEFQDVLLYNFLSTSPLKRQWGVIYQFMKEKNVMDSKAHHVFSPSFDESKHNILCSELKQLYVAVTRTKNRLWICEENEEFSRPMVDYWKKKNLVQFKNQAKPYYYHW